MGETGSGGSGAAACGGAGASRDGVAAGVLRQWRQQAIRCASDSTEVDWLLQQLAQVDKLGLRLAADEVVLPLACSFAWLEQVWQRRLQDGVPLQYLVGHVPWRNFELQVGPGVLIPRPETELLIDLVQSQIPPDPAQTGSWADVGTGSGAIALGLAALFPQASIHGVDCSTEALAIARLNVERYSAAYNLGDPSELGGANRLHLHLGHWLEPLEPWRGQFQGIVSNPPYIPTSLLPGLQAEVRDHEPWLALDGGEDGLDAFRILVRAGADFLAPGGFWAVELMAGQAPAVEALLRASPDYGRTGRSTDLAGIERFVWGYRL